MLKTEPSRATIGVSLVVYAVLSISLTLAFKQSFKAVKYPVTLMAVLMGLEAVVMRWILALMAWCRPQDDDDDDEEEAEQSMLVAIGVCVAAEIGLSNLGLQRMSVAMHTMLKACTPVFVLGASLVLGLETLSARILVIVLFISAGTLLCSVGRVRPKQQASSLSTSAHSTVGHANASAASLSQTVGIILTVAAGAAGGLRWGLTQVLTQHRGTKPRLLVARTLPFSALSLFCVAAVLELPDLIDSHDDFATVIIMYASGIAAVGLVLLWTEVTLVATTSSLSLSIIATTKELILVGISLVGLGDTVSQLSLIGFSLTTTGIVAYNVHKNVKGGLDAVSKAGAQRYSKLSTVDLEEAFDHNGVGDLDALELEDGGVLSRRHHSHDDLSSPRRARPDVANGDVDASPVPSPRPTAGVARVKL